MDAEAIKTKARADAYNLKHNNSLVIITDKNYYCHRGYEHVTNMYSVEESGFIVDCDRCRKKKSKDSCPSFFRCHSCYTNLCSECINSILTKVQDYSDKWKLDKWTLESRSNDQSPPEQDIFNEELSFDA
jgi:hypothetical protein